MQAKHWQQARLYLITRPLRQPLVLGQQRITQRQSLELALDFDDGSQGLGEIAPLPSFSREPLLLAWQQISALLRNKVLEAIAPSVAFGLDCALHGTPSPFTAQSECPLLGVNSLTQTPLNDDCHLAKLKVARHSLEHDLQLIRALQTRYPTLRLRLDANRGWTLRQALWLLSRIDLSRIDYIEEPLHDAKQLTQLSAALSVPLALDESLQTPDYRYEPLSNLRALVIKPSLYGAWQRIAHLCEQARRDGVNCVFSSAYEGEVGLSWIKQLAQRHSPLQAAGLDTLNAFDIGASRQLIESIKPSDA